MPRDPSPDVVIVGAGPTGLMAATLLRRAGVSVRVLDKSVQQAHESRAFAVHARSLELLRSIGLADACMDRGMIANGGRWFVEGRQVAEVDLVDFGRSDTPYPFVLMLPQWELEAILVDDLRAHGVTVEHEVEVYDLRQSELGVMVSATRADGSRFGVSASYVIGADGAHSIVRKCLGLRFEGAAYPQGFLLADCRVEWGLDHDHLKVFVADRNLAVFLPLRGREISRIIAVRPFEEGRPSDDVVGAEPATLDEVAAAFATVAKIPVTIHDARWVTRYRLHHRGVDRYGDGRAFVAGDAAHIHSPAGGQGMNTGLQDAANLAWKLALVLAGRAPATLLDTYDAERRPVGRKVLERTDRLFAMMSSQAAWVARVRNLVVPFLAPALTSIAPIRAFVVRFISQLGIRYRPNAFLLDATPDVWRGGVAPGHRAPDARISAKRSVFDLLRGYRFTVLALSRRPLDGDEIDRYTAELAALAPALRMDVGAHLVARSLIGRDARFRQAESAEVFAAYGLSRRVPAAIFVVRPDGYVAYRAAGLDVAAATRFLQERFAHPHESVAAPPP